MGLLNFFRSEKRQTISPTNPKDPLIKKIFGIGNSKTGGRVNFETALQESAVYSCVKVIGEDIAKLPWQVYREIEPRKKEKAKDHYLYKILHNKPNGFMSSFNFRYMAIVHACLHGDFFALIVSGKNPVDELIPLDPSKVNVYYDEEKRVKFFKYTDSKGREEILLDSEVFHLMGSTHNGIRGMSTISYHAETIGGSLAMQEYGNNLFNNFAQTGMILVHPNTLSEEAYNRLKTQFENRHKGSQNAYKTAILQEGMQIQKATIDPVDAQFIESRNYSKHDIAGIFRVPAHKIGLLDKATFSNIEQQSIDYVTDSLMSWIARFEQEVQNKLFTEADIRQGFYSKIDFRGLLRGDSKTRSEFYAKLFNLGALSPNDIRDSEDMNSIENGDKYFVPLNMQDLNTQVVDDPGVQSRMLELLSSSTDRILTKEKRFVEKVYSQDITDQERKSKLIEFYDKHVDFIQDVLKVDSRRAILEYCEDALFGVSSKGLDYFNSDIKIRLLNIGGNNEK